MEGYGVSTGSDDISFCCIMPQGDIDSGTRGQRRKHVVADCTGSPRCLPSDYPGGDHTTYVNARIQTTATSPFAPVKLCKKRKRKERKRKRKSNHRAVSDPCPEDMYNAETAFSKPSMPVPEDWRPILQEGYQ